MTGFLSLFLALLGPTGLPGEVRGMGGVMPPIVASEARRPQKIAPFWAALPPAQLSAPAQGVVALRAAPRGRVRVAGGRFVMGSTPQEMAEAIQLCAKEPLAMLCNRGEGSIPNSIRAEGHAHEVVLSDFDLDVTEVTVERYMRCVSAGACARPSFPLGDSRYDRPSFPVTHVSWTDARTYCTWDSGRLPTEAEWEYAARGRVNNTFPWGKVYNPHLANHGSLAEDSSDARDGFTGLAPVGSFPDGATATGLLDMAGNAAEWVWDLYERDEQQFGYPLGAQTNPKGAASGAYGHVIRGGSYKTGAFELRAASRHPSLYARADVGFRCAADATSR